MTRGTAGERESRRDTFLGGAEDYFAARPSYPDQLWREVVRLADLAPGASILEVGCGTGEATEWLAEAGYSIQALDRSADMLRLADRRLARFDNVDVCQADFERDAPGGRFDALVMASCYHWLEPASRARRCAASLGGGGSLILVWHTHPPPFTGYFERVQPIYRRLVPGWEPPPSPGMSDARVEEVRAELAQSGVFATVHRYFHDWTREYPGDLYLRLLSTYSDHRLLDDARRSKLFAEVRALIDNEFGGVVTRPYRSEAIVARRPPPPDRDLALPL